MQKIIELAKQYAESYKYCFHKESSIRWTERFAASRWENTLLVGVEITEEEYRNNDLRELFIKEFTKLTMDRVSKLGIVVDEKTGKKTKEVKRKKD